MAKKGYDNESKTVFFEVNEERREIALSDLSDEMKENLIVHGLKQKIGDSYAGAAKAVEKLDMTQDEYILQCIEGNIDQLLKGEWTVRTGVGGPRVTDLAVALSEAYAITVEEAAEKVAEFDADTKKAVRGHPAIKPILDRIRAERAQAKADASAAEATDATLPELF